MKTVKKATKRRKWVTRTVTMQVGHYDTVIRAKNAEDATEALLVSACNNGLGRGLGIKSTLFPRFGSGKAIPKPFEIQVRIPASIAAKAKKGAK